MAQSTIVKSTKAGNKFWNDEEYAGISFWYFDRQLTQTEIEDFLDYNNIASYYSGAGKGFARMPAIRQNGKRTLITQIFGMDI